MECPIIDDSMDSIESHRKDRPVYCSECQSAAITDHTFRLGVESAEHVVIGADSLVSWLRYPPDWLTSSHRDQEKWCCDVCDMIRERSQITTGLAGFARKPHPPGWVGGFWHF